MLFCARPICYVNHIATVLNYDQSTVDQSVEELAADQYIEIEHWKGTTKNLLLTMKGAAAAIFHTNSCMGSYSGVYRQLKEYTKRHHPGTLESFDGLDSKVSGEEQKDFLVYKAMEYVLDHDCFDESGNEKISDAQKVELQLKIAKSGREKFGKAIVGSNQYFRQYGITRKFTKQFLDESEKIISEARKEMRKQDYLT